MLDKNDNIVETYDLVADSLSDVKQALDETIEFMHCTAFILHF
jgi:hypothetical protein